MTNDLISQAEALIEKHATSGYIHRDATLLLPRLVAEIKRLQAQGQAKDFGLSGLSNEVYRLREQLAKWQQIAIKQRALINFIEMDEGYAYSEHVILSDDEISIATKDLGLQLEQEAGYLERLEKEFETLYLQTHWRKPDQSYEDQIREAQAALEKIRRGQT